MQEVPDINPEPYQGTATVAAALPSTAPALNRIPLPADNINHQAIIYPGMTPLSSINYNQMPTQSMAASLRPMSPPPMMPLLAPVPRPPQQTMGASMYSPYASYGPNDPRAMLASRNQMPQPLPYALVPASYTNLLG